MNTQYINRNAVKQLALKFSTELRDGKFTRVSKEFLERVSAQVESFVKAEVERQPDDGKTIN